VFVPPLPQDRRSRLVEEQAEKKTGRPDPRLAGRGQRPAPPPCPDQPPWRPPS